MPLHNVLEAVERELKACDKKKRWQGYSMCKIWLVATLKSRAAVQDVLEWQDIFGSWGDELECVCYFQQLFILNVVL